MTKNLSPAAFLAIVNKDARTASDITSASAYLKRSAFQRALWAHVRVATDGADADTVAAEAGFGTSRLSQVRYGVNLMLSAGIPMPDTLDAFNAAESTYLTVSALYKIGKNTRASLKDAAKRAAAIDEIDGKHAALSAVLPQDEDVKRPARPEGNTTTETTETDDMTGTPVVGGTAPVERPSTVTERLAAVLADVNNGAPIADLDAAMALVDTLSDAIAARAGLTIDA